MARTIAALVENRPGVVPSRTESPRSTLLSLALAVSLAQYSPQWPCPSTS